MRNRAVLTALVFTCLPAGANTPDALAIVQKALDLNRQTDELQREYNVTQEAIKRDVGSDGKVRSTTAETFEVHVIHGEPVQKLIRKNGRPLTPSEARKAQSGFDDKVRELTSESAEARRRRIAEHETKVNRRREMFNELPNAFDFRILGEERVEGHDTWHIEGKPKFGYKPKTMRAAFLQKMEGQFWISKQHNRLVKLEAVTTGTVSLGWGMLARVAPGTRFMIEQMRLSDGVWVTRRFKMAYDVQIALVKQKRGETEQIMWDFRKPPLAASNTSDGAN